MNKIMGMDASFKEIAAKDVIATSDVLKAILSLFYKRENLFREPADDQDKKWLDAELDRDLFITPIPGSQGLAGAMLSVDGESNKGMIYLSITPMGNLQVFTFFGVKFDKLTGADSKFKEYACLIFTKYFRQIESELREACKAYYRDQEVKQYKATGPAFQKVS